MIYLDHNATTAVAPEAIEAVLAALKNGPSNPSSKHRAGECCKDSVMQARGELAQLLNCTPPELVYTSCGTEANHFAIQGALAMAPDKRHIVASSVEHPSVMELLAHLEKQGVKVTYVPVDDKGQIDAAAVEAALTPETALVTIMWANNETGVLMPIEAIAAMTKARGILFHTDAVQAVGKVAIDLKTVPVDMLSLSGHKLHAPTGVGALFVRKGLKIAALLLRASGTGAPRRHGKCAGHRRTRQGRGAGEARSWPPSRRISRRSATNSKPAYWRACRSRASTAPARRASRTRAFIRFGDLEAELILERLDRAGICASAGAACTSSGTAPSHVLLAMGVDERGALASVRFSLGRDNTAAEIDTLLDILPGIVNEAAAIAA